MKIFISWICIISLLSFKGLGADINTDSKTNNPNSESKSTSSNTNESKGQNNVSAPAGGKGSSSNSKGNTPATNSNQGNKSSQNNKGGKDTLAAESGKNANSSNKQSETKNGQTSKSENNKKSELSNNSADSNKSVKEEGFYFNMGGGNHQVGDHIRTYDGSSFVVREITDGNLFFGEFDRSVDLGKSGSIENKFVDPKNGKNNGLLEGEPDNDSGLAKNEGVGGGRAGPAPQTKALSDKQVEDVFHRAGNSQAPDSNDWAMLDAAAFNSELAHFHNYFNELKVENLAALDKSIQEMKTSQIANLDSNYLNLQSYSGSSVPGPLNIQNPLQEQVVSPFVDPDPNATVPYQSAYRAELEDIRNQIIAHTPVSPQQMTGRKVGLAALKTADDHYLVNDKVGGDYFKGIGLVAVDLVSDLNPITSIGKDLYRVFEGRDPLTGESLSGLEQGLAGFFFVTGVISFGGTSEIKAVGKWGYKGIKSAIEIFKENTNISRLFNDTLKMFKGLGKTEREIEIIEQGVKDAGPVIESAAKLVTENTPQSIKHLLNTFNSFVKKGMPGKFDESWARFTGILQDASKGKGNFGVGQATRDEAMEIGKAWVGDGYRAASDGTTLISKDGLRQFRPPSVKPNLGKVQANLEWRNSSTNSEIFSKEWQGNAHLDILD